MTNWSLVKDAALAIEWLAESDDTVNADSTLLQLWNNKFDDKYSGKRIFNTGVLIMASYLYFVYVKENDHNKLDYNTIDTKDFKIVTSDKPVNNINSKEVCRRVRNAISHGSFIVDNELITLEDNNSSQTDHIKLEINIVKFGEFISNFANEVHSQLSGI